MRSNNGKWRPVDDSSTPVRLGSISGTIGGHDSSGKPVAALGEINRAYVSTDPEAQALRNQSNAATNVPSSKLSCDWSAYLQQRIHILSWITKYDRSTAIADAISGITLGLTMIPQSIAYAALAGLPSQYGLYSAFVGSLVYVFFGTIKEVSIGPTSLMALLTLQYTTDKPPEYVVVLAFLAGCVELLMGILRLGFIVDFISIPVTNAFTSSTSLIIIGSQLRHLLGIKYESNDFASSIYKFFTHLGGTTFTDGLLGISCCVFLLALRQLKDLKISEPTKSGHIVNRAIWYFSISRNAITVIVTSFVAYKWTGESPLFKLSGKVEAGIPQIHLPPFNFVHNNETISFVTICSDLGSGIVVVPLVAVLANVAIAKAFSSGAKVDATQEMLTLGVCNILGSCFKSMPTCGAFTRSAVSQASGVRTPLAGLYSALLTILALSLLTPYFYYIPKATLAAVLIVAVVFMIDFNLPLVLWRTHKRDFYAWLSTIIVCLAFGVELGLLFGICLNIFHLLYMWARPPTVVTTRELNGMRYISVMPSLGIFFPGIDDLCARVTSISTDCQEVVPVVVDCSRLSGLDYTSQMGITRMAKDLSKNQQMLILHQLEPALHGTLDSENLLFCQDNVKLKVILTQISSTMEIEQK